MLCLSYGDRSTLQDKPEPGGRGKSPSQFLTHTAWICLPFGLLVSLICPRLDALLSARLPTVESQLFARHFGLSTLLVGSVCSMIATAHDAGGARAILIPAIATWHAAVVAAFAVEIWALGAFRSSPPLTRVLAYGGALAHVAVLGEGLVELRGGPFSGWGTAVASVVADICAAARHLVAVDGAARASVFGNVVRLDVAIGATFAYILLSWWLMVSKRKRPPPVDSLDGKLVVVTGAAGGIGRELALAFGREGARLALWDIRAEALDQTLKWLKSEGLSSNRIRTMVVDVSDADAVTTAAESLRREEGAAPSVVVSNAAVMRGSTLLGATDEEIRSDFATNTLAAFWLARSFLRQMLDEPSPRGAVVTVGSIMADLPAARQSEYCASKAALSQLHECLRWELKAMPHAGNVRSLLIQPYAVQTPMIAGAALLGEGDETCHKRFALIRKLLPPLLPAQVARRIVRAVKQGEERVYIPSVIGWIPVVLSLLPSPVAEVVLGAAGASDGMHGFRGCAPLRTTGKGEQR